MTVRSYFTAFIGDVCFIKQLNKLLNSALGKWYCCSYLYMAPLPLQQLVHPRPLPGALLAPIVGGIYVPSFGTDFRFSHVIFSGHWNVLDLTMLHPVRSFQ